ncbi:MAG: hypothetical protein NTX17_10620 [Candidatus Eisenbacteria bacterium]|nr:hypothetical protein [Candidatus Eisenbacteria bacterium]
MAAVTVVARAVIIRTAKHAMAPDTSQSFARILVHPFSNAGVVRGEVKAAIMPIARHAVAQGLYRHMANSRFERPRRLIEGLTLMMPPRVKGASSAGTGDFVATRKMVLLH